jgi:hypothetical protein
MQYTHPIELDVPCIHEATYGKEIAYTNMFQRCYWDYWRVYTAPSSQLVNANIQFIPGDLLLSKADWRGELDLVSDLPGLNMVAGLQIVPTNSIRQIELDLALSPEILSYQSGVVEYQLNFYKQLGLNELPVEIILTIPSNYRFIENTTDTKVDQNKRSLFTTISKNHELIIFSFQNISNVP